MDRTSFRMITYNLFKGRNWWSGLSALPHMGRELGRYRPDIVLFQEIRGFVDRLPHHEKDFTQALGLERAAYGMNYFGKSNQHGNAIYARGKILEFENSDLSVSRLEKRGILTADCHIDEEDIRSIRLFCTHLDLTSSGRKTQLEKIVAEIERRLPDPETPFVLAGDFNDWNLEGHRFLKSRLAVEEAHEKTAGKLAATYPSLFPMMRLDRVYYRGLKVRDAQVLRGSFQFLSDHCPLLVDFEWVR